jgi:two-component system response regulator WspF
MPTMAIVIVQHIDHQFSDHLINWLDSQVQWSVRVASENNRPQGGQVAVANSLLHLELTPEMQFKYSDIRRKDFYKPSINYFFSSIAKNWKGRAYGTILTGMGDDGAIGLNEMHEAGFDVCVQDFRSCAIEAMPRAAQKRCVSATQKTLLEMSLWISSTIKLENNL